MSKDITILGSGIIGTMTAYFALKQNYKVTLVEKNASAGLGASFQNGGQLSFSHIFSVCDINIFKYILKNLVSDNTPITISYLEAFKNMSWCLDFLKNSKKDNNDYNDLFALAYKSQIAFKEILKDCNNINLKKTGSVQIFRDKSSFNQVRGMINLFDKYHINNRVVSESEVKQLIPSYIESDNQAIYFPDDMCGNAYDFITRMIDSMKLNPNFAYLANQEIKHISINAGKISNIITNEFKIISEEYIVTPGSYIEILKSKINIDVPIRPLKGYSFNHHKLHLDKCLIDHDKKIVYTPMEDYTRISGLYDFAGFNPVLDEARIKFMLNNINSLIKGDHKESDFTDIWCGFRPLTSDKFPLIGNSTKYKNLHYNIGHANLGFTLSSGTSQALIESLEQGESVIPKSFRANRFDI